MNRISGPAGLPHSCAEMVRPSGVFTVIGLYFSSCPKPGCANATNCGRDGRFDEAAIPNGYRHRNPPLCFYFYRRFIVPVLEASTRVKGTKGRIAMRAATKLRKAVQQSLQLASGFARRSGRELPADAFRQRLSRCGDIGGCKNRSPMVAGGSSLPANGLPAGIHPGRRNFGSTRCLEISGTAALPSRKRSWIFLPAAPVLDPCGHAGPCRRRRAEPAPAACLRHLQGAGRNQHRDRDRRYRAAAEAMAARLQTAGFAEADVHAFSPAPHKGDFVARLRGSGARKPILLVGASRRRAGRPRGLVNRSVQADREGRLFLRPRQRRRQIHGGCLCRQPDPLQAGGLQARSRYHRGAGDRRGDSRP